MQLFSLQKGKPAAQLNTSGAGGFIVDLAAQCANFGDTAAAIELMDLIVTTDSGVAHLAGCIGKPALNLLQYKPNWIYGMRGEATASYPDNAAYPADVPRRLGQRDQRDVATGRHLGRGTDAGTRGAGPTQG